MKLTPTNHPPNAPLYYQIIADSQIGVAVFEAVRRMLLMALDKY